MSIKREFNREAYSGINFPWFAVDSDGVIGEFYAGFASIPATVFSNEENYRELFSYFDCLPRKCSAHLSNTIKKRRKKKRSGNYKLYLAEAEKGLYLFVDNFGDIDESSYLLNAIPQNPITIRELPEKIKHMLVKMPYAFSDNEKVIIK